MNIAHDLGYDFDEAQKRQGLSLKDIVSLRDSNLIGIPRTITDKQLALFLDACDGVENAKKVLTIYYKARRDAPEHFLNRDPLSEEIQQCLDNQHYFHLPNTPKGLAVVYHQLANPKPSNYNFDQAIKTYFMTIDACLHKQGPRNGIIFIFDMKEMRFGHLTRVKISSIRKFFHYLQEGLPAKLHGIHVLNVVSYFDKVLSLIKPFMKAELFKLLHTYPPNADLTEFYDKYVPKHCLPSEYGGDLETIQQLHDNFRQEFIGLQEYYLAEEKQRLDCHGNDLNNNNNGDVKTDRNGGCNIKTPSIKRLEID